METEKIIVPQEDPQAQQEIRNTMRLPKWGCFLMLVGFFVPVFLAAVATGYGAKGYEGILTVLYWLFSALFFVGVVLVIVAFLKVRDLPSERRGPGSPR